MIFGGAAQAESENRPLEIVTFGTSLTARGGWQEPLRAALSTCLSRPVEISIVAKAGATSQWAIGQIDAVVSAAPDVVLLEFYANDAALNRFMTVDASRRNVATILDGLHRGLPQSRVLVMAMNPFIGMRGWMRPFAESYIEAHREEAEKRSMEFVDHRPAWTRLYGDDLAAVIPDGLHPLPEKAADAMVPTLVERLCHGR
ncbi:SGNH/GDSL hydrolase family protein [Rhizobium sp. RAF56]|uniref:SGNH/GDSL hydrolase family protein n=1 Tax=Rhizobium sp. RAF56 TaxID=3233062 RepID=UPI003F95D69C